MWSVKTAPPNINEKKIKKKKWKKLQKGGLPNLTKHGKIELDEQTNVRLMPTAQNGAGEGRLIQMMENGRMIKVVASSKEGLKIYDINNEGFIKLGFRHGVEDYNEVVELVNKALDNNKSEIMLDGYGYKAHSIPAKAKLAKWMLQELGYKAKITKDGNDVSGKMVSRVKSKRQSEGGQKVRIVTFTEK